jgi:hypothetical protein
MEKKYCCVPTILICLSTNVILVACVVLANLVTIAILVV